MSALAPKVCAVAEAVRATGALVHTQALDVADRDAVVACARSGSR